MISMAVVIDAIRANKLHWEDKVTISDELSYLSTTAGLSNVPLTAGAEYSVRDLFNASIIESANACVMALADKVAGNQQAFIELMKKKLDDWNVQNYHIITTTGLNNEYISNWKYPNTADDDENTMSARGIAIVSQHIVNEYPEYMETAKLSEATFNKNYQMVNWNLMLKGMSVETEGVDGLKTGTTDKAGACFAGTIKKDNFRIVTVVMNAENADIDKTARFQETKKVMDYVYQNYQQVTIKKDQAISKYKTIHVAKAKNEKQQIVADKNITFVVPKNSNPKFTKSNEKQLTAPVKENTIVETLTLKSNLGYLQQPLTLNLVTKNNIEKANIFVLIGRKIKSFFY